MIVDPVPVALHQAHQMVAPVDPPTQPKRVAKGRAASHPMMHLQARKVTQIASPMPEVVGVLDLTPPVVGLSWKDCPALFEGPIMSGDEGVRGAMSATSGESSF